VNKLEHILGEKDVVIEDLKSKVKATKDSLDVKENSTLPEKKKAF
jgi:hypothetical protein